MRQCKDLRIVFFECPKSCIRGNSIWSWVGCWPDILQTRDGWLGTKECRLLLCRQSRVGRFSIIYQVHDHPTKNSAEASGYAPNLGNSRIGPLHSAYAWGDICLGMDPVYRDWYIQKKHCSIGTFTSKKRGALEASWQMTPTPGAFVWSKACNIISGDAFSVASEHSIGPIDIKWCTSIHP